MHVRSKAPGQETEELQVHRLKGDRVMEMPPKSTMMEANLKGKWEARICSCILQATKVMLYFHPCSVSPSTALLPASPLCSSSPQLLLTLWCQVVGGQSYPMSAMYLSMLSALPVWCWERAGTSLSTFEPIQAPPPSTSKMISFDLQPAA